MVSAAPAERESPPAAPALDGARHFAELTTILAMTQFKRRYYGNVLGYFWTLAKPLMLFGVLYIAFTKFVRFGGDIEHYAAYLITAIVLYTFFADATIQAVTSMVEREQLVRKIPMPVLALPLSVTLDAAITLALNLVAVFVFVIASGVPITLRWLEMPLILAVLLVFTTATAALVANLYVFFRDMKPIWEVVSQLLFWATPIVYVITYVPASYQKLLMVNPLAVLMTQMHHALIDPSSPSAATAAGGYAFLLIPAAIVAALAVLSVVLHRRTAPRIAEQV